MKNCFIVVLNAHINNVEVIKYYTQTQETKPHLKSGLLTLLQLLRFCLKGIPAVVEKLSMLSHIHSNMK